MFVFLTACSGLSSKQEIEVTPTVAPTISVEAADEVLTETTTFTSTDSVQTQDQSTGSTIAAKAVDVDEVITNNVQGIPMYWFIIGALIFGMIIPQPRFIRWLF
jgi:hypothetical protein